MSYQWTTSDLLLPALGAGGRELDKDFYLAFSPERIDPGNTTYQLENTPKVVGGVSSQSGDLAVSFYSRFINEVVKGKGAQEAETAKLLENTYRHINNGLVNEMAILSHDLGTVICAVIKQDQ